MDLAGRLAIAAITGALFGLFVQPRLREVLRRLLARRGEFAAGMRVLDGEVGGLTARWRHRRVRWDGDELVWWRTRRLRLADVRPDAGRRARGPEIFLVAPGAAIVPAQDAHSGAKLEIALLPADLELVLARTTASRT